MTSISCRKKLWNQDLSSRLSHRFDYTNATFIDQLQKKKMKFPFSSLAFFGLSLALLWQSIEATCECREVCPSFTGLRMSSGGPEAVRPILSQRRRFRDLPPMGAGRWVRVQLFRLQLRGVRLYGGPAPPIADTNLQARRGRLRQLRLLHGHVGIQSERSPSREALRINGVSLQCPRPPNSLGGSGRLESRRQPELRRIQRRHARN